MRAPRDFAMAAEKAVLPEGCGDRFSGYAVIGLPFRSGHVLALRRFHASSVGPGYTSVWHRDPNGRWMFHQDIDPGRGCTRYFGSAVSDNPVEPIRIAWSAPNEFTVTVEGPKPIVWQLTVAETVATRSMNLAASLLPEAWWSNPKVLSMMGLTAGLALGAGKLSLTGRTPNGHSFAANPRLIWDVSASRASIGGKDLGAPGPLAEQARLGDFLIPQRGIFAIANAVLESQAPKEHAIWTTR